MAVKILRWKAAMMLEIWASKINDSKGPNLSFSARTPFLDLIDNRVWA